MAYMNQEKKAKISALLKPILAKYGIKGSLSVQNHSTITLTVKSGAIDFISNYVDTVRKIPGRMANEDSLKHIIKDQYLDVNQYWFHEHFTGKAKAFLEEAFAALKGADWFDKSDIQSDYFHTAYYTYLHIGKWNKPYQVVA